MVQVRDFHKKYARINTPPDKNEANKRKIYPLNRLIFIQIDIASQNLPKPREISPLPRQKFCEKNRSKILDSIPVQARRRTYLSTMNTITEFGKYSISEILNRKRSQQGIGNMNKYGQGTFCR